MTIKCSLNLSGFYLEELSTDLQQLVENELRSRISLFGQVSFENEREVDLDIVLTNDMGPHVDRINESYGKVLSEFYNPCRNTVAAKAITIFHPQEKPLRASIVLNQEVWIKDDGESMVVRAYLLFHELGHVLQRSKSSSTYLKNPRALAATNEEMVCQEGRSLWREFDADVLADKICHKLFSTDEGKSVGAGVFLVDGFIGSAADLLERICTFVVDDVDSYRNHLGPLDHLYPTAVAFIQELLNVLAHTASLCIGMQRVEELNRTLKLLHGFNEYIGDDWPAFFNALTEQYSPAVESELARIWKAIMMRIGLKIEDMTDGRQYVHVLKPVYCYVTERVPER